MAILNASNGQQYRYMDCHEPDDVVRCYQHDCQCSDGTPMVDWVAKWENAGGVMRGEPWDAKMYTCPDHLPGFAEAQRFFRETQQTGTAAYLTKEEFARATSRL